jgi:hypothetical protein
MGHQSTTSEWTRLSPAGRTTAFVVLSAPWWSDQIRARGSEGMLTQSRKAGSNRPSPKTDLAFRSAPPRGGEAVYRVPCPGLSDPDSGPVTPDILVRRLP